MRLIIVFLQHLNLIFRCFTVICQKKIKVGPGALCLSSQVPKYPINMNWEQKNLVSKYPINMNWEQKNLVSALKKKYVKILANV